ncbi:MAG TPA: citrate/2-methylcitrate synthase [Candidatus Bilamarchaeaceae archaeon]|nr:citrate/2-methylcitrate synthase [Candidatus Bilamarchaeaceae archaeon]
MPETKITFDVKKGLEGVIVAESKIGHVDGQKGKLYYRGYPIEELAKGRASYEEVAYLLLYGALPTAAQLHAFSTHLHRHRPLPQHIVNMMKSFCHGMTSMEALRTTVSALACNDPDARKVSLDFHLHNGVGLIAKFPTIVAYHHRIRQRLKPVPPDPKLGYAANFLYMLNDKKPDPVSVEAMNADLVFHAEHGFNASTFSARVTISTLSDMHSALTSAVGTLKGPLHGGAAQAVSTMLREIKTPANAERYAKAALARHERIMGFGHRVYKVYDPRARILKKMAFALSRKKKNMRWYTIADRLEKTMLKEKNLNPNVDFYSSIVYHLLGLPTDLDSPIFAIGRSAGWVAHCMEQYADNRLIRPRSKYIGKLDLKYVPIGKRK